jgi:hypothetical protein
MDIILSAIIFLSLPVDLLIEWNLVHSAACPHALVGDGLLGHALLVTGSIPLEDCILGDKGLRQW